MRIKQGALFAAAFISVICVHILFHSRHDEHLESHKADDLRSRIASVARQEDLAKRIASRQGTTFEQELDELDFELGAHIQPAEQAEDGRILSGLDASANEEPGDPTLGDDSLVEPEEEDQALEHQQLVDPEADDANGLNDGSNPRALEKCGDQSGGFQGWRAAMPQPLNVPGHSALVLNQAYREARNPFDPDGRRANGWPGRLQVVIKPEEIEYDLSGEGMLRAEPHMPGGNAFQIVNRFQKIGTEDSFFVRLVGPAIVVGAVRLARTMVQGGGYMKATYTAEYVIKEAGVYSIQVWLEYKALPNDIVEKANPKGMDKDPLKANANTFRRQDILLYTALVDARYPSESAAMAGERARDFGVASSEAPLGPQACASTELPGRLASFTLFFLVSWLAPCRPQFTTRVLKPSVTPLLLSIPSSLDAEFALLSCAQPSPCLATAQFLPLAVSLFRLRSAGCVDSEPIMPLPGLVANEQPAPSVQSPGSRAHVGSRLRIAEQKACYSLPCTHAALRVARRRDLRTPA
ncbi:hypothetical protein CYMTET_50355 [Cymbomonas tetramitiformis]|uniref:Uncharacterized protein n=1 Tax=Cymbomonas tetramitiformis TaxID=36881 RepID=A0AAE0BNE1_9CHLO|nr:hypothetical protein CYMTET_50355 [Cymbomonas tetramitiformis]